MKKKPQEPTQLLDPQQALHAYLDALLNEVVDLPDEEEAAQSVSQAAESPVKPVELPTTTLNVTPEARVVRHISEAEAGRLQTASSPGIPGEVPPDVEIPSWAEGGFQALCFKVAGITLATPLIKLNGIVELREDLTELPGYAPWVMGILNNRGQQTQVADLAHLILPEGRKAEVGEPHSRVHYVILVNDGQFGLAADSLSQVITLEPEEVRWRTANSRRPWLAGMVIDKMCAILDIEQLTQQLASESKPPRAKR